MDDVLARLREIYKERSNEPDFDPMIRIMQGSRDSEVWLEGDADGLMHMALQCLTLAKSKKPDDKYQVDETNLAAESSIALVIKKRR
ncbi:hypothetical protein [Kordiimonas gwangyangensis]|uniref:hypothetical protein n=1 Tax=Kordiimonas gwangyangensis TaxID=288022 RepID=UPI000369E1E6|nr:hypothetical protein [Kordiimonas gwangyangensis]